MRLIGNINISICLDNRDISSKIQTDSNRKLLKNDDDDEGIAFFLEDK